jgi:signal transduction histidine kinase
VIRAFLNRFNPLTKKSPIWRGFSVQLFAVTVLPLTLLLLVIAFGSVTLHQRDMRALVGERDERAVQAATAALESELHHRMASISSLAAFTDASTHATFEQVIADSMDLMSDFDGGLALLDSTGNLTVHRAEKELWNSIIQSGSEIRLASSANPGPAISVPFAVSDSNRTFVVVSDYSPDTGILIAGAFSPDLLARQTLAASYPADSQATIYLLDASGQILYVSGIAPVQSLPADHPGVAEALRGETGTTYVQIANSEHVIAYSSISSTGWALVTEEDWHAVTSPSLQTTQLAPLVLVPAFVLALFALWFGARQIIQPLQRLESKAAALAWGDFDAIKEPVGGISEVQHLQQELTEMANKLRAAQEGLHDYIGAITSAQEEERSRLARELHDDTIQAVIALKQRVQLAQKSVKDLPGRQSLKELEDLAEQTVENLRRLTRALRPIYLEDLGLVTALEMLARETSQSNELVVDFQRAGQERRLSRETELALYRIAQEGLNNIVRHAKAKHATLSIRFDKEIRLEVTDDGMGFAVPKSPTDFAPSGHFGLLGIRERADLMGARLEVRSEEGLGTHLTVQLTDSSTPAKRNKTRSKSQ